jgi:hypothetical protein
MVELDLPTGLASSTLGIDVPASSLVPLEHPAPDVCGDGSSIAAPLWALRPRFVGDRCFLLFGFSQQRVQRSLDKLSRVAVRNLVTQQVLELGELVPGVLADRDLKLVAPGRKGNGPRVWPRRARDGRTR